MGSRINTVMQPCFFQLAGHPAARRGHRPDQGVRREDVREARRGRRRAQLRRHRPLAGAPRPRDARRRHQRAADRPRRSPTTSPTSWPGSPSRLMAGDGDLLPVSALPVDGTFPTGTAQVREAGDRPDDPDLGSGDLHRLRQVRDGLPARDDPDEGLPDGRRSRRRRPTSCTRSSGRATCPTTGSRSRSRPTTAPAAACASTSARPRARPTSSHKAINMEPVAEHRDVERERWDFFQSIPPLDRDLIAARHGQGHARSSSRCSSSRAPAAAAARRRTSASSASSSATG